MGRGTSEKRKIVAGEDIGDWWWRGKMERRAMG